MAINFVVNFEEGAEPSVEDGDGYTETGLTDLGQTPSGSEARNIAAEDLFAYGSRVGLWRILRVFREREVPLTINGCAVALERNAEAAAAIGASGYDVCCHGWRWVRPFRLTQEEERLSIRRAVTSLEQTVGEKPLGWCSRYGPSVHTRNLLVEDGGFLYDSDAYDDELPYWAEANGKPHLVIPYSHTTNDAKFANGTFATATDYFRFHKDALDVLWNEGRTAPKMMTVGLHARIIGHPARAAGLQRLLDYIATLDGVWVTRRIDIARHWIETHPSVPP